MLVVNGFGNSARKNKTKSKKMPIIKNTQNVLKNASSILKHVSNTR